MSFFSADRGRRVARFFVVLATGFFVFALGCATPDARIKRNQALFDTLPADSQALIREGKVALGFSPDMVLLALGDPDQRFARTDANGASEIWSYTTYDSSAGVPLYRGYYHRYTHTYPLYHDPIYLRDARPREWFKVSFREGKVAVIEQESRR
jgi:hypothetical protein